MKATVLQFPETEDERHRIYMLKLWRFTLSEDNLLRRLRRGLRRDRATPTQKKIIDRFQIAPKDYVVYDAETGYYELTAYGYFIVRCHGRRTLKRARIRRDAEHPGPARVIPFPMSWSDWRTVQDLKAARA